MPKIAYVHSRKIEATILIIWMKISFKGHSNNRHDLCLCVCICVLVLGWSGGGIEVGMNKGLWNYLDKSQTLLFICLFTLD